MKKDCSVIILAAGKSTRIKQPKFLLKMHNGISFLESIAQQYAESGCENIVVILNNESVELIKPKQLNLPSQTQIIINNYPEHGRFHSLKLGLAEIKTGTTFIHNVDNPISDRTYLELIYVNNAKADVIKPVNNGKGGHPILISHKVVRCILDKKTYDIDFREFLNRFSTYEVEVDDKAILLNINTEDDYRNFIKNY